jgi:hypothetical protein
MKAPYTIIATALAGGVMFLAACGSSDDSSSTGSTEAGTGTTTQASSTPSSSATQLIPKGHTHYDLNPADFTTKIDNPYFPMSPGDHWVYREVENGEVQRIDVTVTNKTKTMGNGIEARVVHDLVSQNGEPVEDTMDWYAQDSAGTLWYMGEDTAEYKNGKVSSTAGSWEAGVDGAEPGIIMPAQPKAGMAYREEYYAGEAEDEAKITGVDAKTKVPFESYQHVVTTENTSPLEPKVLEHKWYAQGVGPVREALLSGGHGDTVLLNYTQG